METDGTCSDFLLFRRREKRPDKKKKPWIAKWCRGVWERKKRAVQKRSSRPRVVLLLRSTCAARDSPTSRRGNEWTTRSKWASGGVIMAAPSAEVYTARV